MRWFYLTAAVMAVALGGVPALAQPTDTVVAADYAPLMVEGGGKKPGFAVEVMQEAARRAGRDIDITFLPFSRALHRLRTDQATLMPALFHGKDRGERYNWLVEIHRARLRFSSIGERIDTLKAARDLPSIVLEKGTTGDALLTAMGFENVVRVTSPEASARMLSAGRASAWLLTEGLMRQVWQRIEEAAPLTMGAVVHEVPICIVASPATPKDVSSAYRDAVQSMKADGTMEVLASRYRPGLK